MSSEIVIVILWRQTMEVNMCCILIPSILPEKLGGLKSICPRIMDIPGYFKPCGEVNIQYHEGYSLETDFYLFYMWKKLQRLNRSADNKDFAAKKRHGQLL